MSLLDVHTEGAKHAIGAKAPIRTMEAVVSAVFDFANGDATPPVTSRMDSRPRTHDPEGEWDWVRIEHFDEEPWSTETPIDEREAKLFARQRLKDERQESANWLGRVIRAESSELAARAYVEIAKETLREGQIEVTFCPVVVESRNGTSVRFSAIGPYDRHTHWTLLAVAAIAANHDGIREQVGYCRLDGCQKIFFIEHDGPGRKRRKYCCAEHRKDAHNAAASDRVRLSRERRREAAENKTTRRMK